MQFTYTTEKLSNGNIIRYKTYNGTSYRVETPDDLILILDNLLQSKKRITVDYGDTKTKISWGEVNNTSKYIGRSTGRIKIPLLVNNKRSFGGGALEDHCILSIKHANKKNGGIIYQLK